MARRKWKARTTVHKYPEAQYGFFLGTTPVHIEWNHLAPKMSFIIPTTASASEVAEALSSAASFFGYKLLVEETLWQGATAVRVHRIS